MHNIRLTGFARLSLMRIPRYMIRLFNKRNICGRVIFAHTGDQLMMAISFQMQLKAAEYYPGFTRRIYLKGYRYNMHYCPKTLLIEVGAQTNTVSEAMNAMVPLADLLNKVLTAQR